MKFESQYGYVFEWKEFGDYLEQFITKNLENLLSDNFDLVISFKRGGSILGQIFACIFQDVSSNIRPSLCIRDIPSSLLSKKSVPTFLNRLVVSPLEISDIPRLKTDLETEIKKKSGKLSILLVDDNITTGLRLGFFYKLIKRWFGDNVIVKKLIFYGGNQKFSKIVDYIIFDGPEFNKKAVNMPWHKRNIHPEDIIENGTLPYRVNFRNETDLNMSVLAEKLKNYESKIYNTLKLTDIVKPDAEIFKIERKNGNLRIYSGSFAYQIRMSGPNLEICMSGSFDALPKLCSEKKFIIDESQYRLCKSTLMRTALCYECIYMYCSRDIFYFIMQFLKESGMDVDHLGDTVITFHPQKKVEERAEEYIHEYLEILFDERESCTNIFWG